ncbi:DUF3800 domain-containing protein [Butyrivibrio sp. FCS006]|uniref:DUF3800 domain-containing protein n=1 Tax=Butyrivibrio sp. FCS006 TaxID=1280684 RepID=UPI00041B0AF1|nr:DUF3800 domain-containing protein [Butyrivibrio sp. FCS006]
MDRYLIFDESGNLGANVRFFVIACVDTYSFKPLHNVMKRKLGIAKKIFIELGSLHAHEIKAKDAYPCIKYHIAEVLSQKDIRISYIVADLKHVSPKLLEQKNIFYNYLMRILMDHLLSKDDEGSTIHVIYDNHTTKVGSVNSLEEYLLLHFVYDKGYNLDLKFKCMDSDSSDAYVVQAADYAANAIYSHFEYNVNTYYDLLKLVTKHKIKFPTKSFMK